MAYKLLLVPSVFRQNLMSLRRTFLQWLAEVACNLSVMLGLWTVRVHKSLFTYKLALTANYFTYFVLLPWFQVSKKRD